MVCFELFEIRFVKRRAVRLGVLLGVLADAALQLDRGDLGVLCRLFGARLFFFLSVYARCLGDAVLVHAEDVVEEVVAVVVIEDDLFALDIQFVRRGESVVFELRGADAFVLRALLLFGEALDFELSLVRFFIVVFEPVAEEQLRQLLHDPIAQSGAFDQRLQRAALSVRLFVRPGEDVRVYRIRRDVLGLRGRFDLAASDQRRLPFGIFARGEFCGPIGQIGQCDGGEVDVGRDHVLFVHRGDCLSQREPDLHFGRLPLFQFGYDELFDRLFVAFEFARILVGEVRVPVRLFLPMIDLFQIEQLLRLDDLLSARRILFDALVQRLVLVFRGLVDRLRRLHLLLLFLDVGLYRVAAFDHIVVALDKVFDLVGSEVAGAVVGVGGAVFERQLDHAVLFAGQVVQKVRREVERGAQDGQRA